MIFGHFAVSALIHRYTKADLRSTLVGGVFPDVVDKALCYGLKLTPSNRMYAHTLLSLGLTSVMIRLLLGPRVALGWALGYLGHLLADSSGFVPWFYPFSSYRFYRGPATLFKSMRNLFVSPRLIEWLLLAWAVWAFTWGRKR